MKLRLKDNSIRLRLTRPEVEAFNENGSLKKQLETNSASGRYFGYSIEKTSDSAFGVRFEDDVLRLAIPEKEVEIWAGGDEISIEGTDGTAQILVEKDFACLKPRPGENLVDYFPNPNRDQVC